MMSLIAELVEHFGLSANDFVRLIDSAPARYKVYEIPKRRGGVRTIAQPSRELKAVQRFVTERKLSVFPVHSAAMGYVKRRNIRENAEAHKDSGPVLKLDFSNFFPSLLVEDWERFAQKHPVKVIGRVEIKLYSKILFWAAQQRSSLPRCLAIGAPSSPMLSNVMLFEIDTALASMATRFNVVYTSYADDITVSSDTVEKLQRFDTAARRTIRLIRSPRLAFNEGKCGLYLKGQRRMVTGLVITPTNQVSIGRERKRLIAAMLHRVSLDRLGRAEMGHLKGMLGFCLAVEAAFVERMREKYGEGVIDAVLRFRVPTRRELREEGED